MGTVREESEMSRYIDADELERKYMSADYMDNDTAYDVIAELDTAPHIDIVRCKECKHWIGETEHYEDREYKACWQLCGQYMNSEFWCKYGER